MKCLFLCLNLPDTRQAKLYLRMKALSLSENLGSNVGKHQTQKNIISIRSARLHHHSVATSRSTFDISAMPRHYLLSALSIMQILFPNYSDDTVAVSSMVVYVPTDSVRIQYTG